MSINPHVILPLFIPLAGCPHRCVFCDQRAITGVRSHVEETDYSGIIRNMLDSMRKVPGSAVEVAFYGGSFTSMPRERQKRLLCQAAPFIQSGEIQSVRLSTRPDALDEEDLEFLSGFGVSTIEIGVQSMDDGVLMLSGRGHSAEDSRRSARLVKSRGFNMGLQMMTGLPGDTIRSILKTAMEIADLEPDIVRIYPAVVVDDTPMADMWRRGEYRPWSLEKTLEALTIILPLFRSRNIPVGRVGLLLERELRENHRILAGPVHPSLGWKAQCEIARNRLTNLVDKREDGFSDIKVNPKEQSVFLGEKRTTLDKIQRLLRNPKFRIITDERIPQGWFLVDEKIDGENGKF